MKPYNHRRQQRLKIALFVLVAALVVFRHHVVAGIQLAAMPLLFKLGNVANPLTLKADDFDVTFQRYSTEPDTGIEDPRYVVPPIIHNVFIGNNATLRPSWEVARASCRTQHPGYKFEFWDEDRAKDFIQQQFPAVWPMWRDYEYSIQKADSLRYMLLYYYGGKCPNTSLTPTCPTSSRHLPVAIKLPHPNITPHFQASLWTWTSIANVH